VFTVSDCLEELRSHSSEWLEARRRDVVAEVRRLQSEEHSILLVLDERGRIDTSVGMDGESARTVRTKTETARALESLPAIAAAARAGALSSEQLNEVVKLADEESDAEWARRAQNITPADLARLAREQRKPTVEDGQARRAAQHLWMKWDHDRGMLRFGGEAPDVLGAKFEATIKKLTEQMRPIKGQPWEPWQRRAVDALGVMCDAVEVAEKIEKPMVAPKPLFSIDVPEHGPATVAGIPLPDAMVEQLRAMASIEPLLLDDHGFPVAVGKCASSLSPKIVRSVLLRDGHCRCGSCDLRYGLQVHHIRPRTWGGGDEISNLVAVASVHHPMLIPNGPYAIVGNPNLPDGLRTVHIDDLTTDEAEQIGLPPSRARPRDR
jgi:hypothetical protein